VRHVIITGASRGLGQVLVEGLLEGGYRVSSCSRNPSEFIDKMKGDPVYRDRFFWKPCRVQDVTEVSAFIDEVAARSDSSELYGLINNAGIAGEGILATFPAVDATRIIEVNLLGVLYMTRAFLRQLLATKGGGRIINISSIVGLRGYTGLSAYSASKAGIDGLTRAVAREVGRRGITCNSIAPGYFLTEMSKTLLPAQRAQIINRTPLNRLGEPLDMLEAVKFLLSEGASFITGQTLVIDGGITC
jgi:3-oxoacyl-[acyl-carrier protein] reductase